MWRTARGERTLVGAEAALVRITIANLYHHLVTDCLPLHDSATTGAKPFDRLSGEQQLAMLAEVGEALLRPDVPAPDRTAIREATVAAIFGYMDVLVDLEIDAEQYVIDQPTGPTYFRKLVLTYLREEDDHDLPEATCQDRTEWRILIDSACEAFLGNDDWSLVDTIADLPPDQSNRMRKEMRVPIGYCDAIAADPREQELQSIQKRLDALVGK
jgi:hypothetical protein